MDWVVEGTEAIVRMIGVAAEMLAEQGMGWEEQRCVGRTSVTEHLKGAEK